MKGLILAALVGFLLTITLALPFTEDEAMAYNDALGEIRNELTRSHRGSEDYDSEVDSDDSEEDEDKQVEDEDEDDDDDDDVDEGGKSLYSPAQHLSDPIWPILPVVSAIRRFRRRRRRRGRRVGRWFRRRRSRG